MLVIGERKMKNREARDTVGVEWSRLCRERLSGEELGAWIWPARHLRWNVSAEGTAVQVSKVVMIQLHSQAGLGSAGVRGGGQGKPGKGVRETIRSQATPILLARERSPGSILKFTRDTSGF